MPTNDPHASDIKTPGTTLWLPSLPPKERQRIDRARRRQYYSKFSELSGFKGKTVWDYLNLLAVLAIPVFIAAGTLWYTSQQTQATATASVQQHQTDKNLAEDQQEETALQTYLDRMSDLLFTEHLATSQPSDEVRQVARARTITLLPHLNGTRKAEVLQFLYEANLIGYLSLGLHVSPAIVNLSGANLSGVNLSESSQGGVASSGSDLEGIDLSFTNLSGAELRFSDLREANLRGADLSFANLSISALDGANLAEVNLSGANLSETDLSEANLSGARNVTAQQLSAASSLSGAILPDKSLHP